MSYVSNLLSALFGKSKPSDAALLARIEQLERRVAALESAVGDVSKLG